MESAAVGRDEHLFPLTDVGAQHGGNGFAVAYKGLSSKRAAVAGLSELSPAHRARACNRLASPEKPFFFSQRAYDMLTCDEHHPYASSQAMLSLALQLYGQGIGTAAKKDAYELAGPKSSGHLEALHSSGGARKSENQADKKITSSNI